MPQLGHSSRDHTASNNPASPRRQNLPRATHACQWCRVKKAKCDQQQPCLNCTKHSVNCEYGIRRRNARTRITRVQSQAVVERVGRQDHFQSPAPAQRSPDEPPGSQTPERPRESAHRGKFKSYCFVVCNNATNLWFKPLHLKLCLFKIWKF